MRPIEYRADMDFRQGLRCVQYRVSPLRALKPRGFLLGLGLRYGLVGIAAIQHLLLTTNREDERVVLETAIGWPQVVADHARHSLSTGNPVEIDSETADRIGRIAHLPVQSAIPLLRRDCPLDLTLNVAIEDFVEGHRQDIRDGWGLFQWRRAHHLFEELAQASHKIALNFADRRRLDLTEVPEIALLGE